MERHSWKYIALIAIALCSIALAAPEPRPEESTIDEPLSPVAVEENNNLNEVDRDKRKIFGPDVGFGIKNAVLGYVFGDEDETDGSAPVIRVTRATPVFPPGVTDDTPDFNRQMVMLDIPDQLFGSSFSAVTNISKMFGDLIMNSARRYAQFVQYFKPTLGKVLTIKGLYPPPPTTTTTEPPTTTTSEGSTESNEV